MLLQIIDTTSLMEQAVKTQPGDNSGYVFAVTLLSTWFVLSVGAIIHLQKMVNKLQGDMVLKVETMAKANTELLVSIEGFFETITKDLSLLSPHIVREAESASARIKEHVDRVAQKTQRNEPISDTHYTK